MIWTPSPVLSHTQPSHPEISASNPLTRPKSTLPPSSWASTRWAAGVGSLVKRSVFSGREVLTYYWSFDPYRQTTTWGIIFILLKTSPCTPSSTTAMVSSCPCPPSSTVSPVSVFMFLLLLHKVTKSLKMHIWKPLTSRHFSCGLKKLNDIDSVLKEA